ncbi:YusW family protein [Salsuginibacillus kocurii]|uniref:YusW family protein n=1 Tax=Salsuginibacillus kocurii TaxID=427078 RepID=UPI00036937B3|nr:YusW family protein [Salsuginibacillus kocurii]
MKKSVVGLTLISLLAACGDNTDTNDEMETADEEAVENIEEDEVELSKDEDDEDEGSDNEDVEENSDGDDHFLSLDEVEEFELEIELTDGTEYEYEFETDDDAEVEIENGSDQDMEGDEANSEIEELFANVDFSSNRDESDIEADVLDFLEIDSSELNEFELEIKYTDGEEMDYENENG